MDLINRSRYSARMTSTMVEEDKMMGAVIVKVLLDIKDGVARPSALQTWQIGQEVETEFGTFDSESPFRKLGVDFMLLGKAYPRYNGPQNRTQVELSAGDFKYSMDVHGNRRWLKKDGGLVISEAENFESMPLTWERSYGGKCELETGELPFHQNPDGRGFYYYIEDLAENGLLPNLEDPANPIRKWDDQPVPVGTAPLSRDSSLRILNSTEFDLDEDPPRITAIKPSYYNNANPELILPEVPPRGTLIKATNVRPGGNDLEFKLRGGTFHVYVQLDDRQYVFPTHLESIAILAESEQALIGYRCCFTYTFNPLERRAAVLYGGPDPVEIPPQYSIDWSQFDYSEVVDG